MSRLVRSYLDFARGDTKLSPWLITYPLQYVVRAWMKLRITCYGRGIFKVTDPAIPVVSIGNNSLGGTNKTPMTEYVVRQFKKAGIDAGIVSRGYKTENHAPLWVGQNAGSFHRAIAGDEPLMLAHRMPDVKIVVSKDRIKGVALLASLGAKAAVTDDTFQHRRMARDVDIVLVDATCPFGNGQVIPAGIMREPKSAFGRADIAVITKANQVTPASLAQTRAELENFIEPEKIFTAEIETSEWERILHGRGEHISSAPEGSFVFFSAIGNSEGFYKFLEDRGIKSAAHRSYRDHHIFTADDAEKLQALAEQTGACGLICTEKDTVNLPEDFDNRVPIYVIKIEIEVNDEARFRRMLCDRLRPHLLVASNGHGEDAIGAVLAKKMRKRFPEADISVFAFVGSGTNYARDGFHVISPSSDMPSGGVIKYSASEFLNDMRHGLGRSVRRQMSTMRALKGIYRTPLCVGDVYLFASVLWGQGISPVLLATAKSVFLSGHMRIERFLLRKRCRRVWTRDSETARELCAGGVDADFGGSPIMDLMDKSGEARSPWNVGAARVILLPGSRRRAYSDACLVLAAAKKLAGRVKCEFVLVPAPTIDTDKMAEAASGWSLSDDGGSLVSDDVKVSFYRGAGGVGDVAAGADLLIGLGGTANQLCAGLGVPVVSIIEEGKLRQKKLLRDAEILVDADPDKLADAAELVLKDPDLKKKMAQAGIKYMGGHGAADRVLDYCASALGWSARCEVYAEYRKYIKSLEGADD